MDKWHDIIPSAKIFLTYSDTITRKVKKASFSEAKKAMFRRQDIRKGYQKYHHVDKTGLVAKMIIAEHATRI